MTALLAVGILVGIGIGLVWGYLWLAPTVSDLRYDLWNTEDEVRKLQANADYKDFWRSEAQRLRDQHAGTPYSTRAHGVRDGMYSAAWIDDEDAS